MELFKLFGTIEIDNSKANEALDNTSNKGSQTQSKLSKALGAVGKGAAVAGKAVATGLAAGGAAFAGLTAKALSAGGELEQNMGGSEAVFGKYAEKMQNTAKTAFSNMGLSTNDFLATANKMGALFQGAGFSIQESSDLSASAMQRAADVASIMGLDTSAAMEAIAGAAKGNFTMMDNLGVAMNDTTLNAYALEKGIGKTTQEMTNQEKIGLAMELFMEKTAYAAGNYAKENETLAGSLGTAKSALTNFLDGSGSVEDLVSSFGNLANVAVRSLEEILPRLTTGLTDIVNQIMPLLPPLLNQLLPAIVEGAVSLVNGLVGALPGILSALMGALPALLQGVEQIFNALIQALPQIMQSLVSALPTLLPMLINGLVSMIVTLCTNFAQIIQPVIDYLPEIIVAVVNALLNNLPALIMGVVALVGGIIQALPQILAGLWEAVSVLVVEWGGKLGEWLAPILSGVVQWLGNLWQSISQWFSTTWKNISQWFSNLWEGIKSVWDSICNVVSIAVQLIASILDAAFQIITLPFRFIWENCKEYVFAAWEWIKKKVTAAVNAVKDVINKVWTAIKGFLEPILNGIKNTVSTVWNAIKNAISTAVNAVKTVVANVFNAVKDRVSNIFNAVKNTVSNIWNGVKDRISSVVTSIKDKISNVFNSVKETVGNIFSSIKEKMEKPIQKARDTIKSIVDKIKGFFSGMKIEFPKIKMPHFSVSPSGWKIGDLLKGSIPKLGIDWYAQAMQNPIVMTKPTIWGYDPETGNLKGGGEAGSEVVSGTNTLMNMISAAVSAQNDALAYYLQKLIEMLAEYFPQILEGMDRPLGFDPDRMAVALAGPMNKELGRISARKDRGR